MKIQVRRIAAAEIRLAVAYYNSQKPGLGNDFLDCLDELFRGLSDFPHRWPLYHHLVRRAVVSRFPYILYYDLAADTLRVLRVVHARRDPESIRQLLPNSPPR